MTLAASSRNGRTPSHEQLREQVADLSTIHRPSASDGERLAAEWIVRRFEEIGVPARIEPEQVHGDYWLPLALLSGAGALAGIASRRGHRIAGAALGAAAAAAIWDDLTAGERHFRRLLPKRTTWNVVAEMGPQDASRTVLLSPTTTRLTRA